MSESEDYGDSLDPEIHELHITPDPTRPVTGPNLALHADVEVRVRPRAKLCLEALAGVSDEAIAAGAVRELVEAAMQYSRIADDEVNDGHARHGDLEALRKALEPFAGMKGGE